MNEQNLAIAQQLLEKLGTGAPAAEVASMASEDVGFEIPGDAAAFPWIGAKVGRQAFAAFVGDQRELMVADAFRVDDVLVDDTRAVILGELSATIKRNGKVAATYFSIILTITNGQIVRFQMLEDSYAVSQAAT
jgi:ketosteroid isomerase-like protein